MNTQASPAAGIRILHRAAAFAGLVLAMTLGFSSLPAAERAPMLAVIIDDLGFRLIEDQAALALDPRISVAIIPNAPLARRMAKQAHAQERTILVHLPLPQGPEAECDAPACPRAEWSSERMHRHLAWAFEEVYGAAGLNNHQGSQFTADAEATRRLLEGLSLLSRDRLIPPFVIDSRTSPDTRLGDLAAAAGFATAQRDVFLDHDRSLEGMELAWQSAIRRARRHGQALVIGHPHPETIAFLTTAVAGLAEYGVELVRLSEVLQPPSPERRRLTYPRSGSGTADPASIAPLGP
ncbi:MAG: divergent polysaccharide deacetylase family protein [Wenzhouxiangella sp.]